jgi:hypothetical protein
LRRLSSWENRKGIDLGCVGQHQRELQRRKKELNEENRRRKNGEEEIAEHRSERIQERKGIV